jgi:hypothetical protein
MMAGERDLDTLIASMDPAVREGRFVYVTVDAATAAALPAEVPVEMMVREDEGVAMVLTQDDADARGLPYEFVAGWITLRVQSALDAVGLTAAVSAKLAGHGISANVVAGYYHDHLLVPIDDVDRAVQVLRDFADTRRTGESAR